jgi:hypothetical protein
MARVDVRRTHRRPATVSVGVVRWNSTHRSPLFRFLFVWSSRLLLFFLPFALLLLLSSGSSWWNFDLIFDTVWWWTWWYTATGVNDGW